MTNGREGEQDGERPAAASETSAVGVAAGPAAPESGEEKPQAAGQSDPASLWKSPVNPPMSTKAMLDWTQILANVAAAAMLLFASCEFRANLRAQRLQNSINLLNEGLELERKYNAGAATARDIIAFYYRMHVARAKGGLEEDVTTPLEWSLCSTLLEDPRVAEYWAEANRSGDQYFMDSFVKHIDSIRNRKSCK